MTLFATDRLWDEAVVLENARQILRVQSTRDALLCLKNHWPPGDGPAAHAARAACEEGLAGDADPSYARLAFIEAGREAGFQVNSWTTETDAEAPPSPPPERDSIVSDERQEWISKRAYGLWEAEGRPHGRDGAHWEQAARERADLEKVALPDHLAAGSTSGEADAATREAVAASRRKR